MKKIRLKKWQILLIVFLLFVCIIGYLFVRKILFYKNAIEQGSILENTSAGAYSSYNGILKTKESTVSRSELESITDSPWRGSEKPIMTIVEFADFSCPYCLKAYIDLKLFVEENKSDVKLIYRYFPISEDLTPEFAASCANEQGKFWEMHNLLFENQRILSEKVFIRFAKELKLDVEKFTQCYSSKKYEQNILSDVNIGLKSGVNGTPTFFINGEKFAGVIPRQIWDQIFEAIKNDNLKQQ